MLRTFLLASISIITLVGCTIVEREGQIPLPENGPPISYSDMLNRARGQAGAAVDAFYIDSWMELEQAAQRLEQSARLLPKTTHIPDAFKKNVDAEAELLRKDAVQLTNAARTRNATQANEAMQRINDRIRKLRPAEKSEK